MEPTSLALLLATAMLLVAAAALTAYELTQRTYLGFRWWAGALWLNAGAAATVTLLNASDGALAWARLLYLPWPVLCLLGLRRFHARLRLPGSDRSDAWLLGSAVIAAAWATSGLADSASAAQVPLLAAGVVLLYAAAVAGWASAQGDAHGLRALATLWLLAALLPLWAASWTGWTHTTADAATLQTAVIALGSLVTSFVMLAVSSQRTERELRQSRRKLRALANIDMLTQVPNRRRFEELARRALLADEPGSAALLLADIDHFKQINDMLGHAAGDRALKLVSRCTLDLLRAQDVAGRHGGDEFVLLLRNSSTQDAMRVAERLVSHLQAQANAHALPHLTLSFGIVQMRRDESIDDTLQRADLALYEAKRLGRSRAVAADQAADDEQPVFRSSQRLGLTSS